MADGNPVQDEKVLAEGEYDRTGKSIHEQLDNLYERVAKLEEDAGTESEPAGSANHPTPGDDENSSPTLPQE